MEVYCPVWGLYSSFSMNSCQTMKTYRYMQTTKMNRCIQTAPVLLILLLSFFAASCTSSRESGDGADVRMAAESGTMQVMQTLADADGLPLEVEFIRGRAHNHPLMAIWAEDMEGNYLQTLYVAQSIAEGVFRHGDPSTGRWMPGPVRRPAALPYWGHQRGVKSEDGYYMPSQDDPLPDALTGPTPKSHFLLKSRLDPGERLQFRVLFEINQSWDWNRYWTNDRFPGDEHYMTSSQPALVYEAVVDLASGQQDFRLSPIGHSHWSGESGELFPDLSTLTTALEIAASITLRIPGGN